MIKRIWYPNAPSGSINKSQMYQLLIGYPLYIFQPAFVITYKRMFDVDAREILSVGSDHRTFHVSAKKTVPLLPDHRSFYVPLKKKFLLSDK